MTSDQANASFLVRDFWGSDSMESLTGMGVWPVFEDSICWGFTQCLEYKTEQSLYIQLLC